MPASPSVAATPASSGAIACASSSSTAYAVALPRRVSQAGRASSECLALVLDGVLSAAECASLVAVHGDATKLQKVTEAAGEGYSVAIQNQRNYSLGVFHDAGVSDGLWARLEARAGAALAAFADSRGERPPLGLNERLRVLRHAPGERFEPHYDLVVDYPPDRRSLFEAEELDIKCCEFLDDDDIKELIPPLGPRKRFKEAIKKRQTSSSPVTSRAAAVVTPTVDDGARKRRRRRRDRGAICFDELANPVRVDCAGGHEFCRRCWLGWCKQLILKSSTSTTCPSCRADAKLVLDTATMKPFEADRAPAWGGAGVAVPRREASARPRGPASVTWTRRATLTGDGRAESRRRDGRANRGRRAEAEAEAQRRAAVQARRAAAKAAKKERQRERKRTQVAPARRRRQRPRAPPPGRRGRAVAAAPGRRVAVAARRPAAAGARRGVRGLVARVARAAALRPAVAAESFASMRRPLAAGAPQAPIPPSPASTGPGSKACRQSGAPATVN
ncbi:hypothetical protein SO694_00023129 [Aureococcus anophagefferens]|uniref:RING-type domain-containing protein n=1 Tax=Aureococcus anophagefferens TaxID=44056 RepID=A0ABR1FTH2_AURAN